MSDTPPPHSPVPAPNVPDEDLVARALGDDVAAFERLVERYQQAVFRIAWHKSRNTFDAEDLTQDVFLAAFRALDTLQNPAQFSSWLFGIAYNRCHKWYHRERNKVVKIQEIRERLERELRTARKARTPGPLDESEPASAILEGLPEDIRRVLTLKYLEGSSYQEIEARLGIKPHRIDYLIRKGKKALRDRYGESGSAGS